MHRLWIFVAVLAAPCLASAAPEDPDPDTEIAQRHFREGAEAYEAQDYPRALKAFEAARAVRPLPAFDYNIGRTLDRMERFDEAIPFYERYLTEAPRDGDEVRERLKVLKARRDAAAAEKSAAEKAAAEHAASEKRAAERAVAAERDLARRNSFAHRFLVPLMLGGGALVVAAVGAGLLGSVGPDYDALATGAGSCRPCKPARYSGLEARADSGYALLGLGGALAVADVAMWIVTARKPLASARAWVAPTLGGLVAGGRF